MNFNKIINKTILIMKNHMKIIKKIIKRNKNRISTNLMNHFLKILGKN
jgi:hypothetical protein